MLNILGMDTTSKYLSLAFSQDNTVLFENKFVSPANLSSEIIQQIDFVLKHVNHTVNNIDIFSVANGPGQFTSIRVGLTTLKGLLFNRLKSVVPVTTLYALAHQHRNYCDLIYPLIDAKRNEVFMNGYTVCHDNLIEIKSPVCVKIDQIDSVIALSNEMIFIGSGAEIHRHYLQDRFPHSQIIDTSPYLAAEICKIGFEIIQQGGLMPILQNIKPLYIRRPDAEINYQ